LSVDRDDGGLLSAARAGDAEALGAVIDAHYPVTTLVAGFLTEPGQAHEAVERTWLAAIDRLDGWQRPESVRAWVLGLLIAELERAQALDRAEGEAPPEPGRFLGPEDWWEGWWKEDVRNWEGFSDQASLPEEVRQTAVSAVGSLPMLQRVLVLLRDTAGLSLDECASIVGRTNEDQQTLLDWARSSVRLALERLLDAAEQSS
jgi:DNA-directed RNA polymerase specialized sigma24 family protein